MHDELKTIGLEYVVDKIVNSRINDDDGREYLVKWKEWKSSQNTWEPAVNLYDAFEVITKYDAASPNIA